MCEGRNSLGSAATAYRAEATHKATHGVSGAHMNRGAQTPMYSRVHCLRI